ncbi:MAG: hypothetical protein H0U95_18055 [Bacteroidetes bacterium]|nr:hypothetical protein [Bacteroidota bacterium]
MYKAILEVEGKVYSLSSININTYNRGLGYDPNPNDQTILFQIRTTKMDQFIWDWINSPNITKKNGKIKLLNTDENVVIKTISFENGFSSSYNMNFYQNSDSNDTSITLSATKITIQVAAISPSTPGATKD